MGAKVVFFRMENGSNKQPRRPAPGSKMLSQDFIDAFKRNRVAAALGEAVAEVGVSGLSVSLITKRAGMARNTFYDLFDSREDAVRFALDLGNRKLRAAMDDGADYPGPWERRVDVVIGALLEAAEAEAHLTTLCLVHGCGVEGAQAPLDFRLVQTLAGLLRPGRKSGPLPGPPPQTEELLAFGTFAVIADRLQRGEADSLSALRGELVGLVAGPFRKSSTDVRSNPSEGL